MRIKDKIQERIDKIGESHKIADKAKSMSNWLVDWASNNRKKLFVITISFLFCSVVVSVIFTVTSISKSKAARETISIVHDSLRHERNQKTTEIRSKVLDYQTLREYEKEIETLMNKETLTAQDSLRVYELYNILIEQGTYE
jgi:hypothetical protein